MLYICAWEYIITYKLMSHKQTIEGIGIDLFTNIYVGIMENMVNNFNMYRFALDFDSLLLILLVKRNKKKYKNVYL